MSVENPHACVVGDIGSQKLSGLSDDIFPDFYCICDTVDSKCEDVWKFSLVSNSLVIVTTSYRTNEHQSRESSNGLVEELHRALVKANRC